jgi:hypothetical protein
VKRRALVLAAACAAVLVGGGLIHDSNPRNHESATAATAGPAEIAPASSVPARGTMTLDGQVADAQGTCSAPAAGDSVNIALLASPNQLNVTLDKARPPNVTSVVLGTTSMAFMFTPGTDGSADATINDGGYHITGTLLRYGFVSKTFDVTVTCA